MHFEVLVEDASGKIVVDHVLRRIVGKNGNEHTWRTHGYKGLGRLPKDLHPGGDPSKRLLLEQLPRLLRGYGGSLSRESSAVIVVADLDDKDCMIFKRDLLRILHDCDCRPVALFRIAIEEIEAWLLGDRRAVVAAYGNAKKSVLDSYVQDSICGTWELLADAVHKGGSAELKRSGWPAAGQAKCQWAEDIGRLVDPDRNQSPSFHAFRDGVRRLVAGNDPSVGSVTNTQIALESRTLRSRRRP